MEGKPADCAGETGPGAHLGGQEFDAVRDGGARAAVRDGRERAAIGRCPGRLDPRSQWRADQGLCRPPHLPADPAVPQRRSTVRRSVCTFISFFSIWNRFHCWFGCFFVCLFR